MLIRFGRSLLAAFVGLIAAVSVALADPPAIPFTAAPRDHFDYDVVVSKTATFKGKAAPALAIRYALSLTITEARADGYTAEVVNRDVVLTVNGAPVAEPADFDGLIMTSIAGLSATMVLSPAGEPMRLDDWPALRSKVVENARSAAGANPMLRQAVEIFLPQIAESDAIYTVARPLVFAAVARTIAFAPGEEIVQIEHARLPSFFPALALDWVFERRVDDDSGIARDWSAAPDPKALGAILKPILDQLLKSGADRDVASAVAADSNASQYFKATYDKDGTVLTFEAQNLLRAGPVTRDQKLTMELKR